MTSALTDFKGLTVFICYRRISVIANIENKEKLFRGPKNGLCYRQISVTGGSVTAGFNCTRKLRLRLWPDCFAPISHYVNVKASVHGGAGSVRGFVD